MSGTTFAVVTATTCPSTKTSCESKEGHEHREGRGDRHRWLQRSSIHVFQNLKRRGPFEGGHHGREEERDSCAGRDRSPGRSREERHGARRGTEPRRAFRP